MNATETEFLLLARRWKDTEAKVAALFANHEESASSEPLARGLSFVVRGRVVHIDEELSVLVISAQESGMVSLGFQGASFDFGTRSDLEPSLDELLPATGEVSEVVTILLPSGLSVICLGYAVEREGAEDAGAGRIHGRV
jgi:hypothetical protein